MPWDNVPEDKWDAMEKCVTGVMADGKDKESATAICYKQVVGDGDKKEKAKRPNRLQRLAASIAEAFADFNAPADGNLAADVAAMQTFQGGEFTAASGAQVNQTVYRHPPATEAPRESGAATERALPMQAVYEQVYIAAMKQYPMAYMLDLYTEPAREEGEAGTMYAVLAQEGKLYRSEVAIKDGAVSLSAWQAVEVDFQPAPVSAERAADLPTPGKARVSMVRQKDGRVRWFSQSCSAVLNRSGEIDGTALFDSFIAHAEATGEYPIRQFYHAGEGFKTGQADFLARDGFVYLTSGLFDDSDIARAEIAAREREPEYWGESIGYDATKPPVMVDVGGGVRLPMYVEGIHREISTLPEKDAAALFTRTAQEVRRMTLSQRQLDEWIRLWGDEEAARKWLEEHPEATNRQIMDAALVAREVAAPPGATVTTTTEVTTPGATKPADGEAADDADESDESEDAEAVADEDGDESEDETPDDAEAENERAAMAEEVLEVDQETMDALTDAVIHAPAMQGLFASIQTLQATLDAMSQDATAHRMRDSASLAALSERLDSLEESADTQRSIWQDDLPARRRTAVTYRPRLDVNQSEAAPLDMAAEAEAVTDSFPS